MVFLAYSFSFLLVPLLVEVVDMFPGTLDAFECHLMLKFTCYKIINNTRNKYPIYVNLNLNLNSASCEESLTKRQ